MNNFFKFIKTSGVYFLGKALSFIVTFVMLKIYTANVSKTGYGYYDLVVSYIQSLIPFVFIEIWSGMLRRTLLHKNEEDKEKAICTSLFFTLGVLVFYCSGFFIFSSLVPFESSFLIFIYSVSYLLFSYFCILARALKRNKLFAVSGIIGSLSNAAIGLISIYLLKLDYQALFLAVISNYLIQAIVVFLFTKSWRFFKFSRFDKTEAKELFKFCLPLALNTLVNYAYTGFYKTIVNVRLGTDILGVYAVSIKFAAIITFVGTIFHLAWQEMSYSISEENNKTHVFVRGLELFGYVMAICSACILPLIKFVFPIVIATEYYDAENYVPYYYLYIYFFMMNGFMYNILAAENKTTMLFVGKLIGTIVLMGLMFVLLPYFNILSVPISIVVASIFEYVFLRLYTGLKYSIKYFNYSLIIALVFYFAGCFIFIKFDRIINLLWLVVCFVLTSFLAYLINRRFVNGILSSVRRKKEDTTE